MLSSTDSELYDASRVSAGSGICSFFIIKVSDTNRYPKKKTKRTAADSNSSERWKGQRKAQIVCLVEKAKLSDGKRRFHP